VQEGLLKNCKGRCGLRAILALLILCGTVSPQVRLTSIQVRVDDGHGAAIPGAKIDLSPRTGAGTGPSAETDYEGNAILQVPVGSYQVLVSSKSFCPRRWGVEIPSRQTLKLAFSLHVGPCNVSTVEVTGAPDSGHAESPGPARETSSLKVLVTDASGAVVSNADVQARCVDSGLTSETTSDAEGRALVALGAGKCAVSVQARGFESFSQTLDLAGRPHQAVTAVLKVGQSCSGLCPVVNADEEIEFQRFIPEEAILAIPIEPVVLPARRLHFHRRFL
jgi:hypothetical protein